MGLFSKLAKATRKGIPGRDSGGGMGSAMARPAAPRPTLVQGGPAYFTPQGYTPPMQPQQAFMPTDTMGDPIGDMFRAQPIRKLPKRLPPDDRRFPPPRDIRDEFISIGGVGGRDGREERMPPVMPSVDETPMDIPMDNMMIDRPMISGLENPNLFNFDFSNIDMDAINQRIADAGGTIPQDPVMPPIDTPAQSRIDAIREARGMPPRIKDNFMSIDRMDEPRDKFIPPKRILDEMRTIGGAGGGGPIFPSPGQRVGEPSLTPFMPTLDFEPQVSMEEAEASRRADGGGREPIDITNMGQSLYDSYNAGLNNLDPYEQTIRRIARDGGRPIFGSGIMPPTPDFLPEEMPMMPNPMPMPMQQRMPMPAPIASPIPSDPMPMAPVDLPRLELPKINRMDRMNVMDRPIPMMPRMGGRGRR